MANTDAQNDALMREINEAVRRDDMEAFARRWGMVIIGAIVVGLIALAGYLWWRHDSVKRAEAEGERYAQMLVGAGTGTVDQSALAALKASSNGGYAGGAALVEAAVKAGRGDRTGAAADYGAIAANADLPQSYRDLALLRQVSLQFDTLAPQQVIDRLKPLAEAGGPWFGSAGELTALAYLKLGKPDLAGALYAAIAKDAGVPRTIQTRAVQMASLLGIDARIAPTAGEEATNTSEEQAVAAE